MASNHVYLLEHVRLSADGTENLKFLGVHSTEEMAMAAYQRYCLLPGFCDDCSLNDYEASQMHGFYLTREEVDRGNHWPEGYVTV
jgi:hypothetical protein